MGLRGVLESYKASYMRALDSECDMLGACGLLIEKLLLQQKATNIQAISKPYKNPYSKPKNFSHPDPQSAIRST